MIAPPKPPTPGDPEALIKEARARQLRRRLLGAAGVAMAAAIGLVVYASTVGDGGQSPAGASNAAAPLCRSLQLSGSAYLQGASGTMLGGVAIRNTSALECSLPSGRPAARMSWDGQWLPTRERTMAAPAGFSDAGVLAPGAKAVVLWQWWSCGGPGPRAAVRPGFQLRFGHGLVVIARSTDVTPAFCSGLGGTRNLDVSSPLTEQ
jgi:Protein of unknown function (DUF4232)